MTINLKSKSGSGGLGNGTSDPRRLPIYLVQATTLKIKTAGNGLVNDSEANFWTVYERVGSKSSSGASSDTWYTIANITSNPGILYNAMTAAHTSGSGTGEIKFRFTVDGTEYIIASGADIANRSHRLVMGAVIGGSPVITDITDNPFQAGTYEDTGYGAYAGSVATLPSRLNTTASTLIDPLKAVSSGHPYLVWNESLKVEYKVNVVHTAGSYYRYAGVNYSLIATS